MQSIRADLLSDFILERLRLGEDLRDGVIARAREIVSSPQQTVDRAKARWIAADPVPNARDESGAYWARALKPAAPLPPEAPRTDLARLAPTRDPPAYVSILSLLDPPKGDLAVSGVGGGVDLPPAPEAGLPRARRAGVAALITYRAAVRRFHAALPNDVARAASESLRLLIAKRISSLPPPILVDEAKADRALIEARRAEVDVALAERVFAMQKAGRAPSLDDVARLFARPSPEYARAFRRAFPGEERPLLFAAYSRGGAFEDLVSRFDDAGAAPSPGVAAPPPPRLRVEPDREIDVGLRSSVPISIAAAVARVPRSTARLRATLHFDGREIEIEERAASEARYFRWLAPARGGAYRVTVEALDEDGVAIASGSSGELRVRQYARCLRCPERIDFSEPNVERECRWSASPRPGSTPTVVDPESDFEFLATYGECPRLRAAAAAALARGRFDGKLVVPGEPAAPEIEYRGVHSPYSRLPDLPRISDAGELLRGSLVVRHEAEMLDLELAAADRDADREVRDRAVEALLLLLSGRDLSESADAVAARNAAAVARLEADLRGKIRSLEDLARRVEAILGDARPPERDLARLWTLIQRAKGLKSAIEVDVERATKDRLRRYVENDLPLAEKGVEDFASALLPVLDGFRREVGDLEAAIARAREASKTVGDSERLRATLDEARDRVEKEKADWPTEIDDNEAFVDEVKKIVAEKRDAANVRIALLEAEERAESVAEEWNVRIREIVERGQRLGVAKPAIEIAREFAAEWRGRKARAADAERLYAKLHETEREYRAAIAESEASRERLERLTKNPPDGVDEDLLGLAAVALGRAEAEGETWKTELGEIERLRRAWGDVVLGHFDKKRKLDDRRNVSEIIAKLLEDSALAERDDFPETVGRLEREGREELEEYAKALETERAADEVAQEIGVVIDPRVESPIAGLEAALEKARDARALFLAEKQRRARETEADAQARRVAEFEDSKPAKEFDALADVVDARLQRFRGVAQPDFDAASDIQRQVEDLEDLAESLIAPAGASAEEAADLRRDREQRLDDIRERDRGSDSIVANAIAGELVMARDRDATFAQRSSKGARKAANERLARIDRALGMLERISERKEVDTLVAEFQKLRSAVERNGREAANRLRVRELAAALVDRVRRANADFAETVSRISRSEDLIDAIAVKKRLFVELAVAHEELSRANGEYQDEFREEGKAKLAGDATTKASKAFAAHATAADATAKVETNRILDVLRGTPDAIAALDAARKLEVAGVEGASDLERDLSERLRGTASDLRGRIKAVEVPDEAALERDRRAAIEPLAVLASLRDEVFRLASVDPTGAGEAIDAIEAKEEKVRAALRPARERALAEISSAYTYSRYGGDAIPEAERAHRFLREDDEAYGGDFFVLSKADPRPWPEVADALRTGRGRAIGPERCGLRAYVRSGDLTCALDSIVMLAAKADPPIMGRLRATKADDVCASRISAVLGEIDDTLGRGETAASTCNDLRAALFECAERGSEGLGDILYQGGRPMDMLDVADVLAWLNAKYAIEPVQITAIETFVPSPTRETPIPLPPRDERKDLIWPYGFSQELFRGPALHDVEAETPPIPPRSFAIKSDRGFLSHLVRAEGKEIATEFARWGFRYRLVAVVHWKPGHYWITFLCGGAWYRYDGTRAPNLRRLERGPIDADLRENLDILFYSGIPAGSAPGEAFEV